MITVRPIDPHVDVERRHVYFDRDPHLSLVIHLRDRRIPAREVAKRKREQHPSEGVQAIRYEGIRAQYDRIPKGEA